jgi:hypothetical protein
MIEQGKLVAYKLVLDAIEVAVLYLGRRTRRRSRLLVPTAP